MGVSIHHWQDGQFTNQPDERILRAAAAQDRVLVTFDLRTIPAILTGQDSGKRAKGRTLRP